MNTMKRAWELYKSAGCSTRYEFSVALKIAHVESKIEKIDNQLFTLDMVDRQSATEKEIIRGLNNQLHVLKNKIDVSPDEISNEIQKSENDAYNRYQDIAFDLGRLVRSGKCNSNEYKSLKLELQEIKAQYKFIA